MGSSLQVHRAPTTGLAEHLQECVRVLGLPLDASGMHWHPFGVYTIPLARRTRENQTWSRRLHIWHPSATPVGPASPYGVHTHTGTGVSHVLVGALHHHLYAFEPMPGGTWRKQPDDVLCTLVAHVQETTVAGETHMFGAHQPHGVSKPPGLAISLFEQLEDPDVRAVAPFTTWQDESLPEEALVRTPPAPLALVQQDALAALDQAVCRLDAP